MLEMRGVGGLLEPPGARAGIAMPGLSEIHENQNVFRPRFKAAWWTEFGGQQSVTRSCLINNQGDRYRRTRRRLLCGLLTQCLRFLLAQLAAPRARLTDQTRGPQFLLKIAFSAQLAWPHRQAGQRGADRAAKAGCYFPSPP